MTLTLRSKIAVRYTTNPADFGYDGKPSNWLTAKPEVMSVRKAAAFRYALGQKIGQGTYARVEYQHNGRSVSREELDECVFSAEYDKFNKGR